MTLMILDDQTNVVRGIMSGVDWEKLGFEKVIPTYHVAEARAIMEIQPVDVLLCDIEMPVENGLSFLHWIRSKNLQTECIFLTAHAEFQYAQEAVRLDSCDYIIQPAPYEEIQSAVERAIIKIKERHEERGHSDIGRAVSKSKSAIEGGMLRDFLLGYDTNNYHEFEKLGVVPSLSRSAYLALINIVDAEDDKLDELYLVQYAFGNILTELFAPYEQQIYLAVLDERNITLVISPMKDYQIDQGGVERLLTIFCNVSKQYFGPRLACYVKLCQKLEYAGLAVKELMNRREYNVSMKDGIFFSDANEKKVRQITHVTYSSTLRTLFDDKLYVSVMESTEKYLDDLAEKGQLSKQTLEEFYQEFLMVCYSLKEWESVRKSLSDSPGAELFHQADRSIMDMKQFVRYIVGKLSECADGGGNEVEKAISYIHDNIEQELKVSELAEYVHLSPNYLNKKFKNETGISIKEYIIQEKLNLAHTLLTTTNLPVNIVSSKVGYSNFAYFSKIYKQVKGKTPSEERLKD
ncbi:AraC family transcriptional regulator [Enterocloster citroniae]|uniref:response regulator transcription factor n=1 Tax=Enterocloster citroniae TaxID=358743 RepID=UPI001D096DF7|nr:AraC family transcriptional regulator [Enterocloster citroniae]MCB7065420.1 AraC family transcriptional regulator [Enterocloster citroniae]